MKGNKDAKIERAFLEDFKHDLTTDIQTLHAKSRDNTERLTNIDSIISALSSKNQLADTEVVKFYHWNLSLAFESYFIPEKSTIRQFEANNSGHLIASKPLKDKLFRYYSNNERIEANTEKEYAALST